MKLLPSQFFGLGAAVVTAWIAALQSADAAVVPIVLAPIRGALTDCSAFTHAVQLTDTVFMTYLLTTSILSIRMAVNGTAWVGFGISPDGSGKMVGSDGIIGLPFESVSRTNPGKYSLSGYSVDLVTLRDSAAQTLSDIDVYSAGNKTYLYFTKQIEESGENPITTTGVNYFLWVVGLGVDLSSAHDPRNGAGAFSIDAASTLCTPRAPTAPIASTSPAPASFSPAPASSSAPVTNAPVGAPTTTTAAPTRSTTTPVPSNGNASVAVVTGATSSSRCWRGETPLEWLFPFLLAPLLV